MTRTTPALFLGLFLLARVPGWGAETESGLFSEAESRYLARNYTAALEAYDSLLSAYPLSDRASDIQYRRAVCLYRLERFRDSLSLLDEIGKRYPSTRYLDFIPFWKGLCQYQLGSYSVAADGLDAFLSATRDAELTPQALLYRSLCFVGLKDYPRAVEPLQTIVKTYRGADVFPYASVLLGSLLKKSRSFDPLLELTGGIDPSPFPPRWKDQFLLYRADALWEKDRITEAEPIYRGLTAAQPDVALDAYRRLVSAAQRRQDLAGMQALTREAEVRFAATPDLLTELWTRIGLESYRRGALPASELFLQRVWDLRKTRAVNEIVPLSLAEIMLGRKDPAAARALLEEYASGGGSASPSTVMRLGDISLQAGDLASAEMYYGRFLSSFAGHPRTVEAGYFLAYVQYRLGKMAEAERLVSRFLQDPSAGAYAADLLRLRGALLKKQGKPGESAAALTELLGRFPTDTRARVDLLKTLFELRDFPGVMRESDAVLKGRADAYSTLLATYLRGLGSVASKDYPAAARDLSTVTRDAAEKAGLGIVYPYAAYYLGWAHVKTGALDRAAAILDALAEAYPRHELAGKVLFLSGWSHFSLGEYDLAAGLFTRAARAAGDADLASRGAYLAAKSLLNAKRLPQATEALQTILRAAPPSPFAESARFDYAGVLEQTGATAAAAEAYLALADGAPGSPLAEEALYRRAEAFQDKGMYAEARAAFTEYRRRYPKGKLLDAALYWGGEASIAAGEKFGAVLLWEQLASGFPASSFRAASLRKTADVYRESREFTKALALYTQLISEYPEEARGAKADIAAEQIRYQLAGLGDREAELTARISGASGAARAAAMVELARMYILSGEAKAEQGFAMLPKIISLGDPAASFQARFLAGEYFYRKGDLAEASKRFLDAAVAASASPDSAAWAVYRAAEMMKLASRPDQVAALVKRLQDSFPSSPWSAKGRALLEAAR